MPLEMPDDDFEALGDCSVSVTDNGELFIRGHLTVGERSGSYELVIPREHSLRLARDITKDDPELLELRDERDALKRHYDAAAPEHNLLELLDMYMENELEAKRKLEAAEERLGTIGELLSSNGCDCECDCGPEEHDDDCDLCLAHRIDEVLQ